MRIPSVVVMGLVLAPASAAAISRAEVMAEAQRWVDAQVHYSQGVYGGYCAWNYYYASPTRGQTYRPDCSGYVSAAWGLPGEGRTTWGFAPADGAVSDVITWDSLLPGDALNKYDTHIMLFGGWTSAASGDFWVYEESVCGTDAHVAHHNRWADAYWGNMEASFAAIRFHGIDGAPPACDDDTTYCDAGRNVHKHGGTFDGTQCVYAFDDVGPCSDCGGLDYAGECFGGTLRWCENAVLKTKDCTALGQQCGWQDATVGNNCLAGPPPPSCDDDVTYCDGGRSIHKHGGFFNGSACAYVFDDVGSCGGCGSLDYAGRCDGATLIWCEGDEVQTYDCSTVGRTCTWQDATVGNNCVGETVNAASVGAEPRGRDTPPAQDPTAGTASPDDGPLVVGGCSHASANGHGWPWSIALMVAAARFRRRVRVSKLAPPGAP